MSVLRSRLYDLELSEAARGRLGRAADRWSAAGDRSEKIRTYNFPDRTA